MRVLVTGSEGFLGSRLCRTFDHAGVDVTHWDLKLHLDLLDPAGLRYALSACDAVVHLAANADVRGGWADPTRDLQSNVVATSHLLEAMRACQVKRFVFASSAAVYGNAQKEWEKTNSRSVRGGSKHPRQWLPTRETWHAQQTSLYGASKIAAEALIGAYVEAGHLSATIFRFVSLLGPGYSHGHVADFVASLRKDPNHLSILGDGQTPRSYLDVDDACSAILTGLVDPDPGWEVLNAGTDHTMTALESAAVICEELKIRPPAVTFTGESWRGDHPILLDCTQLRNRGWEPRYTIREALARTVEGLK